MMRETEQPEDRTRHQRLLSGTDAPAARPVAEPLLKKCVAEFVGTGILVLFGCGAVHTATLIGAQSGLWQVAIVWGLAVTLAIYAVGAVSGAHINSAITLAFASRGKFPWSLVAPYIASQMAGAFSAAALLFVLFGPYLAAKEQEKHVVRGQPGSEVTAMCYGEYFPNPSPLASSPEPYSDTARARLDAMVSEPIACLAEIVGTMFLALMVFAVTDDRNSAAPAGRMAPAFIGLTIAMLISVIAPLTQACFNPARDFGPRLFAFFAGWGSIAIPGPRGFGFATVYVLSPIAGALIGGHLYDLVLRPSLPHPTDHEV
jgi:glycerol uptake facilitator protein